MNASFQKENNQAVKAKILFVEDDLNLGFVTKDNLEWQGYEIAHFEDGVSALTGFKKEAFDLCILDVMLPKMDGFSLAEEIRKLNREIPIIFLTAKSLTEDKIKGLRIGGDDYITKPYSIEELILKINIFLRRSGVNTDLNPDSQSFMIGDYEFKFEDLELLHPEGKNRLTLREAEVLRFFCKHKNHVVRRDVILKEIWGEDDYFYGRSLDVFISRLRKYLRKDSRVKIENIHGVGFRLSDKKST